MTRTTIRGAICSIIEIGDKEVDVDVVVIYFARITLKDSWSPDTTHKPLGCVIRLADSCHLGSTVNCPTATLHVRSLLKVISRNKLRCTSIYIHILSIRLAT